MNTMIYIGALLFAFATFVSFSLTMQRHQQELLGRQLGTASTSAFKILSWLGVLVGYACTVLVQGWLIGTVGWIGEIIVGALLVVLLITFNPRIVVRLATPALVVGLVLMMLSRP
jgi:hypothetical protein